MIYFTSDLHFGHNKEFIYKSRGFTSIQEHDEEIIKRWNSIIQSNDIVYILGDLMLGDNKHGIECINQLNGQKKYIIGNHDTDNRFQLYNQAGLTCLYFADIIHFYGYRFYISHYPTYTAFFDNNFPLKQILINLYGHTHQDTNYFNGNPFMYHVGVDSHNCYPVSAEQIIEELLIKKSIF